MQLTRIYSDSHGESHFEMFSVPLKDAGDIGFLSRPQLVGGLVFRETEGDYDFPWHNTPRRQYVIMLEGQVDITVSDGETKRFGDGDVVLLEDTQGVGHYSKAVNGQRRKSIFVTLPQ